MPANDRWNDADVLKTSRQPKYSPLEVHPGVTLTHTGSNTTGAVAGFSEGEQVVLVDDRGKRKVFRAHDGAFKHNGLRVALRAPSEPRKSRNRLTASGSIAADRSRAKTARASRLWVEGIHDAELVEKVWGDDLRECGVVVEPMHGADDLPVEIARYGPQHDRRLGILLDHLVPGSKESLIAEGIADANVLIRGHPYVDVWAAIKPSTIGIEAWPEIPIGTRWKQGIIDVLEFGAEPPAFWHKILDSVDSYRDLQTPLVNAVEQLIDFVTSD